MKKSIKITIDTPCHEDWSNMTPSQKGKHCASCQKEVIDFTSKTDEYLYKTVTSGTNLCGRFTKSQLNRAIRIQRKEGKSWINYAASLLIPAAILSTQEIKAQSTQPATEQTDTSYRSLEISSLSRKQKQHLQQDLIIINGTISDTTGPLPGVTITIKGTEKGTQADFDGNYEIEAALHDVLVFSYVSFETQEIKIKSRHTINVVLQEDPNLLGEIIVGGFSTIDDYYTSTTKETPEERKAHLAKVRAYQNYKRAQKKEARKALKKKNDKNRQ